MFRYRFVFLVCLYVCLLGAPRLAGAQLLYGIADNNHLVVTDLTAPSKLVADIPVTGLRPLEYIHAIDLRPRDGQLYGLAVSAVNTSFVQMRVCRIHMLTGVATPLTADPVIVYPAVYDDEKDMEFDPKADEIRIILTNGINFRVNPDTGLAIDANPATVAIEREKPMATIFKIGSMAYSDSYAGTNTTTLYAIDHPSDRLVRIGGVNGNPSPNEAGVTRIGLQAVVATESFTGFDIALPGNQAYASVVVDLSRTDLYRIDLTTGVGALLATLPKSGKSYVRDIAISSGRTLLYMLTHENHIVRVFSNKLDAIVNDIPVTGLPAFAKLRAIAFRPSTGVLYTVSDQGLLYTVDLSSSAVTLVGNIGTTLGEAAMAFDPVTGDLRIVTPGGVNRRINLTTTPMTVTTAADLPATGIVAVAYGLDAPPVSIGVLYGINTECKCLMRSTSVGTTGTGHFDSLTATAGFDIDPSSNIGYLTASNGTSNDLSVVDLANGAATNIGFPLPGVTIVDVAVEPNGTVRFDGPNTEIDEPGGNLTIKLVRGGNLDVPFAINLTTGGTAQAGADYGAFPRMVVFLAGETSKMITIPILNDGFYEGPYEELTLTLDSPTHGARVVTLSSMSIRIIEDDPPTAPPPPPPPPTPPPPTPNQTHTVLLAEGATGPFFDLDILLANPSSTPVTVTLTFLKEDGTTATDTRTLPATSRTTVRVDEIPGLESTSTSTVVTSDRQVIVERTMRWAYGAGYGAHTEKAVDGAASTWYFAEGSQGFFSTYLLLANPHASENTVTVEFLRESESPVTRTYTLAPNSRRTIDPSGDAELVNRSFGMIVTFAQPGVAERAMYFGADPYWKAGHESAGVTAPSSSWFLAEGATGPFFDTFVLLSNPQTTAAEVTLTYLVADGAPIARTKTVPAQGRLTINLEGEDTSLTNAAVATQVASSVPIVVERAQYWPYTFDQWYEAHNSFGVVATDRHWGLAEGRVGGPDGYGTYILLANPGTTAATATITFLRTNGTTLTKTFTVPAQSRFNVSTGPTGLVPELADAEFSAVIHADQPIAVERAMYSSPGGVTWSAGTNATATRLAAP